MKIKRAAILAAGLLGLFGATRAQANDGKEYPAMACIPWSGHASYYGGFMVNADFQGFGDPDKTLYVDCPAVHDTLSGTITSGIVRVLDRHASSNVSCTLSSRHTGAVGNYSGFGETHATTGSGGWTNLNYGAMSSGGDFYYLFTCSIPSMDNGNSQSSMVGWYYLEETGG